MSTFQPFNMERYMSAYEQDVKYNLSESGVHPMLLSELLELKKGSLDELLATDINYAHANGRPELRENIARMYEGATADNVLVTVGAIEANYNSLRTVLNKGDEVVIQRGLKVGELLVTVGQQLIDDGSPIRVVNSSPSVRSEGEN